VSTDDDGVIARALDQAEASLAAGAPEAARGTLDRVSNGPIDEAVLARFLDAFSRTNRFLNRHKDTVAWIEARLFGAASPVARALFLRARIASLRQYDPQAALDLVDEALAAAERAGDREALANLLCHAAFCAYRRGDAQRAIRYADAAALGDFHTPRATIDALRAQLFAATAAGAFERALELASRVRELLLREHDLAGAANEHNNCAEEYLHLGLPDAAMAEANQAIGLATRAGHHPVARHARSLLALAACEAGDLATGLAGLRQVVADPSNIIFWLDTALGLSFWLLERNADGDAAEAAELSGAATARAAQVGVLHLVTALHATAARAARRLGDPEAALAQLARARQSADAADRAAELHLALALAELHGENDPARTVALRGARSRLLAAAEKRRDPRRFCTSVRLHRRILESSGGIPTDLPGAGD
jgi:tetratricopeptide (TPR) repeat protein